MDEFVDDVVRIEREIVESLIKAGARYIHIDAPGFTAYVDGPSMDQMRSRGEDPAKNFARSIRAESQVVQNLGDVTTAIHLCRGNQHSMWHREGSYDAIAERLFNELPHDRFLLEYDTPRAGSFEPLRFVPRGKVVVLELAAPRGRNWRSSTISSAASKRRRNSSRSISSPSARNAASPPTSSETASISASRSASSNGWWKRPARYGASAVLVCRHHSAVTIDPRSVYDNETRPHSGLARTRPDDARSQRSLFAYDRLREPLCDATFVRLSTPASIRNAVRVT